MKKFEIVFDPNGDPMFRVHKFGCPSVRRETRAIGAHSYVAEGESALDAVASELCGLQANGQGYTMEDFTINPCCKEPAP